MGDVIDLKTVREAKTPHISGKARCLACKSEWICVAPVGVTTLECPQCKCDGHFIGSVLTKHAQFHCDCGWPLFRIDPIGPYCPNCGVYVKP